MKVVIHRGSHEIGAACIEVRTNNTRLIFDAGLPLESSIIKESRRPSVLGLWSNANGKIDALFLTHAHADHSGLVWETDDAIPVYLTQETSKILLAGALFAGQPRVSRERMRYIVPKRTIRVGELKVTAFEVDHSTVGAVAFLIENESQRVFYSGDLRFHGLRPELAKELETTLTSRPPDAMLMEGTRLGARASEENESEKQLLERMVTRCSGHQGPIFVSYSPLHLDRFRTFHSLARRLGRRFVIDSYQDFVLHLLRGNLPRPTRDGQLCSVLMQKACSPHALKVLRKKLWFTNLRKQSLKPAELRDFWDRAVILYRPSMDKGLFTRGYPRRSLFLYSYWSGYLDQAAQKAWLAKVHASGAKLESAHASGHAHPKDLFRFVNAIKPRLLVPVHTAHPEEWAKAYPQTRLVADGELLAL